MGCSVENQRLKQRVMSVILMWGYNIMLPLHVPFIQRKMCATLNTWRA